MALSARSLALLLVALVPAASAQSICYDRYGNPYRCYGYDALPYGARVGIGIGVAAFILLLCCGCTYWRRKQVQKQWARYRPPALPFNNGGQQNQQGNYSYGQGQNPYANNPPPPGGYQGQQSSYSSNQYGNNPPPPASTYQPSMAGQYGYGYGQEQNRSADGHAKTPMGGQGGQDDHEHGYEWEQAREAERLERERNGGAGGPPGYDVSTAATTPVVTGTQGTNDSFAPPPGAPPSKRT